MLDNNKSNINNNSDNITDNNCINVTVQGEQMDELPPEHGPAYFENKIIDVMEQCRIEKNIEDLSKISHLQWQSVLLYIYNYVFKPSPSNPCLYIRKNNICRKTILDTDNIPLLDAIADIYINICLSNNHDISLFGYSILSGIDASVLSDWANGTNRFYIYKDIDNNKYIYKDIYIYKSEHPGARIVQEPSSLRSQFLKKIQFYRENTLKSMTLNGNIGALALGKIESGWVEGSAQININVQGIEHRTSSQIAADYGLNLEQKND